MRHRFHVAQKGADVESIRFPTVLNVWPVLAPSELLVLSSASHELFVVGLWVPDSLPDIDELWRLS